MLKPQKRDKYTLDMTVSTRNGLNHFMHSEPTLMGSHYAQVVLPAGKWLARWTTDYAGALNVFGKTVTGDTRAIIDSDGIVWSILVGANGAPVGTTAVLELLKLSPPPLS